MAYRTFNWKGKELCIDENLAVQLDTLIYNIKKDWDFVIIVSGDRMVRVGKSVLAQAVCAYLGWALEKRGLNPDAYNENNIFFDNKAMIDAAYKLPKNSVLHYDEGREGLAAVKAMSGMQQDLIDFFTECGQLNHIFVIVAPDFYDLKEDITVARSEILLNVYRHVTAVESDIYNTGQKTKVFRYDRGFFTFFNRKRKAIMYDMFRTTRRKAYNQVKCNFIGRFTNQYCIDEEVYRKLKSDALGRFRNKKKEELIEKGNRRINPKVLKLLLDKLDGKTMTEISTAGGQAETYLRDVKKKLVPEEENKSFIEANEIKEMDIKKDLAKLRIKETIKHEEPEHIEEPEIDLSDKTEMQKEMIRLGMIKKQKVT